MLLIQLPGNYLKGLEIGFFQGKMLQTMEATQVKSMNSIETKTRVEKMFSTLVLSV